MIFVAFKWPWLNFCLSVLFLLSPLILSIFIQGNKGDFIHNVQTALPSVSRMLAFLFVVIGFISLYQKNYKKSFHHYQSNLKELNKMSWNEFEHLITQYFKKIGFTIKRTNDSLEANFTNLEAYKDNHKIIIYCEYWNIKNLNAHPIREAYKEVDSKDQLYVITTGNFTTSAKEFAQGKKVELINGYKLVEWRNFI